MNCKLTTENRVSLATAKERKKDRSTITEPQSHRVTLPHPEAEAAVLHEPQILATLKCPNDRDTEADKFSHSLARALLPQYEKLRVDFLFSKPQYYRKCLNYTQSIHKKADEEARKMRHSWLTRKKMNEKSRTGIVFIKVSRI